MASATSKAPPLPLKPARFHIAQLEKLLTGEIQPTPTPKFSEDEIRQMIAQIEKSIDLDNIKRNLPPGARITFSPAPSSCNVPTAQRTQTKSTLDENLDEEHCRVMIEGQYQALSLTQCHSVDCLQSRISAKKLALLLKTNSQSRFVVSWDLRASRATHQAVLLYLGSSGRLG